MIALRGISGGDGAGSGGTLAVKPGIEAIFKASVDEDIGTDRRWCGDSCGRSGGGLCCLDNIVLVIVHEKD